MINDNAIISDNGNGKVTIKAMRPQRPHRINITACTDCTLKHLGSAFVYHDELWYGYPNHILGLVGELRHAEREVQGVSRAFAQLIRDQRLIVMHSFEAAMLANTEGLGIIRDIVAGETDRWQHFHNVNSKGFFLVRAWYDFRDQHADLDPRAMVAAFIHHVYTLIDPDTQYPVFPRITWLRDCLATDPDFLSEL